MSDVIVMFLALVAAHAACDYPLQGDFLAKAKNRMAPIPGVPWWQALGAHAAIHGGAVGWVTGLWWLGVAEAAVHAVTDDLKCRGRISFNQDQAIHIGCKVLWVIAAAVLLASCGPKPPPEVRIVTQRVEVPIRVPCKPERPATPVYATQGVQLGPEGNIFDKTAALLAELKQRQAQEALLNGALDRCE